MLESFGYVWKKCRIFLDGWQAFVNVRFNTHGVVVLLTLSRLLVDTSNCMEGQNSSNGAHRINVTFALVVLKKPTRPQCPP